MAHVGDRIESELANWSFAGVSEQFDAHVSRSVPLYHEGHRLIMAMADFFLLPSSTCYDLGCSTGTLLSLLAERNRGKDVRFVGIDTDPGMVERAREACASYPSVTILESDLLDVPFDKADVVIAYYTMQFVRPRDRQVAFDRIYEALNWGGAFCCFEKVRAPDARSGADSST
jgi:tRNA (cmo5U34)-methyltransferase